MKFLRTFSALCCLIAGTVQAQQAKWDVLVRNENLKDYEAYVAEHHPFDSEEVNSEGLWRHTMEIVLYRDALLKSGCNCDVGYKPIGIEVSHARTLEEVRTGRMISTPIAAYDIDPRVAGVYLLSEPVLKEGEFFVGLYTHKDRQDILEMTSLEEIANLKFGVVSTWAVDRQVLETRDLKQVPADTWQSLLKLVKVGRADVVMQPFSPKADMSFSEYDLEFKPIPGIKMLFPASRRYIVSKNHPDGQVLLEHIDRGLGVLRKSGKLREYLTKSGVIDPRIDAFETF